MSKDFDGEAPRAAEPTGFDLMAFDPHYVMPQAIKGDLDTLFSALDALSLCAEAADQSEGPTVTLSHMAPLQRSLSVLGKRLMGDVAAHFPKAGRVPQA